MWDLRVSSSPNHLQTNQVNGKSQIIKLDICLPNSNKGILDYNIDHIRNKGILEYNILYDALSKILIAIRQLAKTIRPKEGLNLVPLHSKRTTFNLNRLAPNCIH